MRLHRNDEPGDDDEPDDGWIEASEASSGSLGDFLATWDVVRHWSRVPASTAAEAIGATHGVDHVEVRTSRAPLTMLYLTKQELETLLASVGASIGQAEANLQLAQSEQGRSRLRADWQMLNSLRTAVAEARYGLMTAEEIEAEAAVQREARSAGIIR